MEKVEKRHERGNKPTLLSMFSGCGGMDLGFKKAGYRIVFANDSDPDACATYRRRGNGLGKITEGDIDDVAIPRIQNLDVLAGGFPCQAYSNAGSRRSIADKRGALYEYCLKYIKVLRPKVTIFENVRGFLSIHGKSKRLIEEVADALVGLDYRVYISLVNAADYGVPQQRLRIFMIGVSKRSCIGSLPFPEKIRRADLTLADTILDIPEDAPNQKDLVRLNPQAVTLCKLVPPGGSWKDIPYSSLPARLKYIRDNMRRYRWPNFYRRYSKDEIAGTVTAAFKPENAGVWHPVHNRVMSVREIARIQTFPDNFVFKARSVKAMYQMIGNAVPPRLAQAFARSIKRSLRGRSYTGPVSNYFEVRESLRPVSPGDPPMIYEPNRAFELFALPKGE